jgi:hypothetical protein
LHFPGSAQKVPRDEITGKYDQQEDRNHHDYEPDKKQHDRNRDFHTIRDSLPNVSTEA